VLRAKGKNDEEKYSSCPKKREEKEKKNVL
jgi:hypothetical protein